MENNNLKLSVSKTVEKLKRQPDTTVKQLSAATKSDLEKLKSDRGEEVAQLKRSHLDLKRLEQLGRRNNELTESLTQNMTLEAVILILIRGATEGLAGQK